MIGSSQVRRKITKIYDIDKIGNAHVKRIWTLENLTEQVVDLPLFFIVEQTDQILNVKASVPVEKIATNAFTKIRLDPKPKLEPKEKYEFFVEYDETNLAYKFSEAWVVVEDFTKEKDSSTAKFHEDDEYEVEIRLPILKRWWAFWESVESIPVPDAKHRKEGRRTILSWSFVLRPDALQKRAMLYHTKKNAKLISLVSSVATLVVTILVREFLPIIIRQIMQSP